MPDDGVVIRNDRIRPESGDTGPVPPIPNRAV